MKISIKLILTPDRRIPDEVTAVCGWNDVQWQFMARSISRLTRWSDKNCFRKFESLINHDPQLSFCWNEKEESIANKGGRNNRRRFTARKEIKFFFCKIKFLRQCCIFETEEKFLAKNNLGGVLTLFWRFSWPFKLTFNVGPGFRWNDVVGRKHFKWKKLTNADSVT